MATNNPVRRIAATATDLAVLNAETTGKVLLRQTEAFEDVVKATVEQVKNVVAAESFRDAMNSQQDYFRTLGEQVRSTSRDNWSTLRSAGSDARNVVRGTFRTGSDDVASKIEETFETAKDAANNTVEDIRHDASAAVDSASDSVEELVSGNNH